MGIKKRPLRFRIGLNRKEVEEVCGRLQKDFVGYGSLRALVDRMAAWLDRTKKE